MDKLCGVGVYIVVFDYIQLFAWFDDNRIRNIWKTVNIDSKGIYVRM